MKNPFRYGIAVDDPYFVGREQETNDIKAVLTGGQSLVMYSPRRFGKTSLVLRLLKELRKEGYQTVYLDFFKVNSRSKFTQLYFNGIMSALPSWEKALRQVSGFLKSLRPGMSLDSMGNPSFTLQQANAQTYDITEVFDIPQKLAGDKPWIVVFDEFQDINKLNGETFEKEMRASLIHHDKVSYVFMGSQMHMLLNMFKQKRRAFYQFAGIFELRKINPEIIKDYISDRFATTDIQIAEEVPDQIIDLTQNIPHYVQYMASVLWELAKETNSIISSELLEKAVDRILINQQDYFYTMYDNLTAYQQKVLLAVNENGQKVLSLEFGSSFGLRSVSSTQRALERLQSDDIIEKDAAGFHFVDPFFSIWLKRL